MNFFMNEMYWSYSEKVIKSLVENGFSVAKFVFEQGEKIYVYSAVFQYSTVID